MQLAGDPLALFLLGVDQASAQAGESLLGHLALGDVHTHTEHAFGVALSREIEFAPGGYPSYRAVPSNHPKFRSVRPLVFGRLRDRAGNAFPIFGVNIAIEFLSAGQISIGL